MALSPQLFENWYVACESSALGKKPLAVTILDTPLALFRDGDGRAAALLDRCPHRMIPLSRGRITDGRLACAYHGWQFDGAGTCTAVPGLCGEPRDERRNARAFPVIEQQGYVWVYAAQGEPSKREPYRIPLVDETGYTSFRWTVDAKTSLLNAIENVFDPAHTHFVHAGLIRTNGKRKPVNVRVRRSADRVEAEYLDEGQQQGLIMQLFGGGIETSISRFLPPSIAQIEFRRKGGVQLLINLLMTPATETSTRVFAQAIGAAPRGLGTLAKLVLKPLFVLASYQDQRMMELQGANIARFGGREHFAHSELDHLRRHVAFLIKGRTPGQAEEIEEKVVRFEI